MLKWGILFLWLILSNPTQAGIRFPTQKELWECAQRVFAGRLNLLAPEEDLNSQLYSVLPSQLLGAKTELRGAQLHYDVNQGFQIHPGVWELTPNRDWNFLDGKDIRLGTEEEFLFVVPAAADKIYLGEPVAHQKRWYPPSLLGGKNPRVRAAGRFFIRFRRVGTTIIGATICRIIVNERGFYDTSPETWKTVVAPLLKQHFGESLDPELRLYELLPNRGEIATPSDMSL